MLRKKNILSEFNLQLFSLKDDKRHEFDYQIGDEFFQQFEHSLIEKGSFDVHVVLEKSETLLQFSFIIKGIAQLTCDRSLDSFDYPMEKTSKIVFKYGESFEEVSDELIILTHGTSELNIADWLYQLLAVSIPYKKLHPRFKTSQEDGFAMDNEEELELVYSDEGNSEEEIEENAPSEMWEQLKNKFNKE